MPPISVAVSSPPKSWPVTLIPNDAMSTTGNLPSASRNGSILTPLIAPENSSPATAGRSDTLTDSVITKAKVT